MTYDNADPIYEAKACARRAIREVWPAVEEAFELTNGMYEFDAIDIEDETYPVSSVSIMHNPKAGTFALVENPRQADPPKDEAVQAPAFRIDGSIDWDKLAEDHGIAYLRGDLATSLPGSYTIDEMRRISEAMDASTDEVEAALRADFDAMSPQEQGRLLNSLKEADSDNYEWWSSLLVGPMPDSVDGFPIGE